MTSTPTRRTITMLQPWATLTVCGIKILETRAFQIPPGRLWIHAAKSERGIHWLKQNPQIRELVEQDLGGKGYQLDSLPLQSMLGWVDVTGCQPFQQSMLPQAKQFGYLIDGRVVWSMTNNQVMKPEPIAGKQGIWYA